MVAEKEGLPIVVAREAFPDQPPGEAFSYPARVATFAAMPPGDFLQRVTALSGATTRSQIVEWASEHMGVSPAQVYAWLRGDSKPRPWVATMLELLEQLAVLGRPASEFENPQATTAAQLGRWALAMREQVRIDASAYICHLDAFVRELPVDIDLLSAGVPRFSSGPDRGRTKNG